MGSTLLGLGWGLVSFLLVTVPTAIVPTPFFTWMTPVRPLGYLFLVTTVILSAAIGATFRNGSPALERMAP
jgi:hypothetical protein